MRTNRTALAKIRRTDGPPEPSQATQKAAAAANPLTDKEGTAKELQLMHIKEFLPYVSLDTLKGISALINAEMGIPGAE